MDTFKRAVWIIGAVVVVVTLVLVGVCLWALNRKGEFANKIAPAMKNRWVAKDKPVAHENGIKHPEVDDSDRGGGAPGVGSDEIISGGGGSMAVS